MSLGSLQHREGGGNANSSKFCSRLKKSGLGTFLLCMGLLAAQGSSVVLPKSQSGRTNNTYCRVWVVLGNLRTQKPLKGHRVVGIRVNNPGMGANHRWMRKMDPRWREVASHLTSWKGHWLPTPPASTHAPFTRRFATLVVGHGGTRSRRACACTRRVTRKGVVEEAGRAEGPAAGCQ